MTHVLDSRQLRAFVSLARTGSFTATARQLGLSQSAVSHAMKTLEGDVGCVLFARLGKKAALTEAGEQLLVRAESILAEMANAREELTRLGQWGTERIRIGASSTACEFLLPTVLREFKESFPRARIVLEPGDSAESLAALRQRRVDLAIALVPQREDWMEVTPLFEDELQFVVHPAHPWAVSGHVQREELTRETYIVYKKQTHTFRMIEAYFAAENLVLPSSIELGAMNAIKEMAKLGIGVGIISPWIAEAEIESGSLVALPLGRRKLRRQWAVVTWDGRRRSFAEETFIGLCRSVTADAPWR